MLNRKQTFLGLTMALSAVLGCHSAEAQTSEYIVLSGDQGTFSVIQNGLIVRSWPVAPGSAQYQYPIAIRETIRTMGANEGDSGAEYDLFGVDLGPRYVHPAGPSRSWDGTTDGRFNYSIDTGGSIYSFDLDWSNPVFLFKVSGLGALTYDPDNDSLWVGVFSSSTSLTQYTMSGTVISSFSTGHTQNMAVALDHADGTLWIHDRNRQGTFEQWSRSGQLLQTVAVPGMSGQNALAGEFALVAPGLTLRLEGSCPGPLEAIISGATPNGLIAVVYGTRPGPFTNPGDPCRGIVIDLSPPFLPGAPAIVTADAGGNATLRGNAPAGLCGRGLIQVVDLSSCEVSNLADF